MLIALAPSDWLGHPLFAQQQAGPRRYGFDEQMKEIEAKKAELERVRTSPEAPEGWKERLALEAKLRSIHQAKLNQQQPLFDRIDELNEMPSVAAWAKRVREVEDQLNEVSRLDRSLTLKEGAALSEKRHLELKRHAPAATPGLKKLGFDALSFPRIDGSTSTQPLAVVIACRCFDVGYAWTSQKQRLVGESDDGTRREWEAELFGGVREPEAELAEYTVKAVAETRREQRLAPIINNLLATNASTHQSYLNLIDGRSDIGLLARPPSESEQKLAAEQGVKFDVAPCALDGFVFIVNSSNPVRDLTHDQIRDIYTNRIKFWRGVGGGDTEVHAYQREEESGSQQLMQSLVMQDLPLAELGTAPGGRSLIGHKMLGIYLNLTVDEQGIGYSLLYYEQYMSGSPRTRVVSVDGVQPTRQSIAERRYPYISEVYVVTRQDIAKDSPASRLRSWLLSEEGQAVVQESGYVPLAAPQAKSQRK